MMKKPEFVSDPIRRYVWWRINESRKEEALDLPWENCSFGQYSAVCVRYLSMVS